MPPCKRIKRLERELREERTKFVENDIELNQVKLVVTEHLNSAIIDIREQAKSTIQKLETELSEANNRLKEKVSVGDNTQLAQIETNCVGDSDGKDIIPASSGTGIVFASLSTGANHLRKFDNSSRSSYAM